MPNKTTRQTVLAATALAVALALLVPTAVQAQQRTYYGADGKVIGRSITGTDGTVTTYGVDGHALTRESGTGSTTTIYDARTGNKIGTVTTPPKPQSK